MEAPGHYGEPLPADIGGVGGLGIVVAQMLRRAPASPPTFVTAAIGVVTCLVAVGLASTAVSYLDQIEQRDLPQSAGSANPPDPLARAHNSAR